MNKSLIFCGMGMTIIVNFLRGVVDDFTGLKHRKWPENGVPCNEHHLCFYTRRRTPG